MADSASAPAPAPATGRGRPASAAPGPIELADEKTVQTLATPDSFGAPQQHGRTLRPLIPPYRLIIVHRSTGRVVGGVGGPV